MKNVLTVAGSDSCSGAGIQADLKTISALGAYGLTVITAVTAQNTCGVRAVSGLSADIVRSQLDALIEDIPIHGAKTGMLFNASIIDEFCRCWEKYSFPGPMNMQIPLVVDPVMISQSGASLLEPQAVEAIKKNLLPLATVATPNIPEAQALSGVVINGPRDMAEAGRIILEMGCRWVVITGGHLPDRALDVVVGPAGTHYMDGPLIDTPHNHGTGCTYSAALASLLAQGRGELEAMRAAKDYVTAAMRRGCSPGKGYGVLGHFPD